MQSDEEDSDDNKDVDSALSPSGDIIASIVQESSTECSADFEADIKTLQAGKMIDSEMEFKLTGLHKSLPQFKKVNSESIPMYKVSGSHGDITFSSFVEVTLGTGTQVIIRKKTVLWLFEEGERVSSDRLFRVRTSQPFSFKTTKYSTKYEQKNTDGERSLPIVRTDVKLGEVCAFMQGENWSVGKVFQFSKDGLMTIMLQVPRSC